MKEAEEIIAFLDDVMCRIVARPNMYCRQGEALESVLRVLECIRRFGVDKDNARNDDFPIVETTTMERVLEDSAPLPLDSGDINGHGVKELESLKTVALLWRDYLIRKRRWKNISARFIQVPDPPPDLEDAEGDEKL